MYFVGAVTITIKHNNKFTGLCRTYRISTEKLQVVVLIKTEICESIKVA